MSTNVRTSNQSRASTKIVIGFVVLLALLYVGKMFWENRSLKDTPLTPIAPGRVNLVGLDTRKGGYHIIVANGLAQLIQSPGGAFGPGDSNPGQSDNDDSGGEKKRVPLKELIETLQGKSAAVGKFVSTLNDMKDEDLPPSQIEVDWTAADLQKAIAGDATLKKKLEDDLNTHLDGTPLDRYRPSTFQNGIVIKVPVSLQLSTGEDNKASVVAGELLYPFQSALMKDLEARVHDESSLDAKKLSAFYAEVGQTYIDKPTRRQNVGQALGDIISKTNVDSLTELPQTVLDSIQILANETMITHASYASEDTPKGKIYNMDIELTDEGRKRLWQYSRDKVGGQLLLVVDGIAVAAPRIGTELAQKNLTISNLPDESIARDATDKINAQAKQ